MQMPPRSQFLFLDGATFPNKYIPISVPTIEGGGAPDGLSLLWPFHSFSAPCQAASHLEQFYQEQQELLFRPASVQNQSTNNTNKFIRSQSESAALNKLSQMNLSRMPRSLFDEFQMCRLQHLQQSGASQTQIGVPGTNMQFKAQQPGHLDSDSEDSLVSSPDDEAGSPFGSGNEEDDELDQMEQQDDQPKQQQQQQQLQEDDQVENDNYEEDLGLGPMDKDIERDRDRLAFRGRRDSYQIAHARSIEQLNQHKEHLLKTSASLEDACDYVAVPLLLASLDIAQPVQPSPMVHLPLQVSLLSIDESSSPQPHENVIKEEGKKLEEQLAEEKTEDNQSTKRSRHVRFADDCGQCLQTVRMMTEPSDYPPKISPAVLRRFRRAAIVAAQRDGLPMPNGKSDSSDSDSLDDENGAHKPKCTWKLNFKQPASEYIKFRETLESQKVALENVMLKNDLARMIGTIKVANIAFHKKVFIRFTADRWQTSTDKPAQYQSSPSKTSDTFRFDIEIPRNTESESRLEFCVCYNANGNEYWDSNGGANFVLLSSEPSGRTSPDSPIHPNNNNNGTLRSEHRQQNAVISEPRLIRALNRDDAYRMDWNSPTGWSSTDFASWRQLSTDGPYW